MVRKESEIEEIAEAKIEEGKLYRILHRQAGRDQFLDTYAYDIAGEIESFCDSRGHAYVGFYVRPWITFINVGGRRVDDALSDCGSKTIKIEEKRVVLNPDHIVEIEPLPGIHKFTFTSEVELANKRENINIEGPAEAILRVARTAAEIEQRLRD